MKPRFQLFRRGLIFYCEDTATGKQTSLRTKNPDEAQTLLHSKNEAFRQPLLNLQIARTYLAATDPQIGRRTWQEVMDEMAKSKTGPTLVRHHKAMKQSAFDSIKSKPIVETQATDLLRVLHTGTVSTNIFLRRLHNFALGVNWLPWPILPKKTWPKISFKEKRAITCEEHETIIAFEENLERRASYECCWYLGASQSDIANLKAEDIDWTHRVVTFQRKKTGAPSIIRIGDRLERVLRSLPHFGPLFPKHRMKQENHRAREFWRACHRLNISGVSLHSYRYAWAERARACGYPERFAQEALGHQSKAVHRAYSSKAQVTLPPLEEYEKNATSAIRSAQPMIA